MTLAARPCVPIQPERILPEEDETEHDYSSVHVQPATSPGQDVEPNLLEHHCWPGMLIYWPLVCRIRSLFSWIIVGISKRHGLIA